MAWHILDLMLSFPECRVERPPMEWIQWAIEHGIHVNAALLSLAGPVPSQGRAPDRGRKVKRAELISSNQRRWPTAERDLKDAATNGLSAAKVVGEIGWWWEGSAIEWARARGKVQDVPSILPGVSTKVHRMQD